MIRRKGEIRRADLKCKWPLYIVLAAEKVRGLKNSEAVHGAAKALSAAPLMYSLRRRPLLRGVLLCEAGGCRGIL
jgi:hypothetical protein